MNTPICDFIRSYAESSALRLHMPGHKGLTLLGPERLDITEIEGADVLYRGDGIITQSEAHAASLFGAGKTLYSTEGSSLAIRAMVYLARLWGREHDRAPLILAARNAHKSFMSAAALCDVAVEWLFPQDPGILSCRVTEEMAEAALSMMDPLPSALYVTSPDYLGNISDIAALSRVCRKYGILLLADNAHGSYLHFLPEPCHPMDLGADLCCDSAHKTLPVLTGGAYLHLAKSADPLLLELAEQAMMLFASTSPSYLILQSLDAANRYLGLGYREKLAAFCRKTAQLASRLRAHGYTLCGEEPLKLTILAKPFGYTGEALAQALAAERIVAEFADPDYLVLMLTPELQEADLSRIEAALTSLPQRPAIGEPPPRVTRPERILSVREALFAPSEEVPTQEALGRVLSSASLACPPAIPIVVCGEVIGEDGIRALAYYGIDRVRIVKEVKG